MTAFKEGDERGRDKGKLASEGRVREKFKKGELERGEGKDKVWVVYG